MITFFLGVFFGAVAYAVAGRMFDQLERELNGFWRC